MVINIIIFIYFISILISYVVSKQATVLENKYHVRDVLWPKGQRNIIIFASLLPLFNIVMTIFALFRICELSDFFTSKEESKW